MSTAATLMVLLWFVGIVVTIAVILAVFHIRAASIRTANRLDDIYSLLSEQNKS